MHRVDTADVAAVMPVIAAPGPNPDSFFRKFVTSVQRGTVVPTDWLNSVQEEIAGAIEAAGLTLTKGTLTQLEAAIIILAGSTDTTLFAQSDAASVSVFTAHGRVIISCLDSASGTPSVTGAAAAAIACDGGVTVSGAAAAAIASRGGTAGGVRSLLAATDGLYVIGGERNSVISCEGSGANSGNGGALIACQDNPSIGTGTENGLIAASSGNSQIVTGADQCAIIGSEGGSLIGANGDRSLMLGVNNCRMGVGASAAQSAIIGCGNVTVDGAQAVILASLGVAAAGADVDNEGAKAAIIACSGTAANPTRIDTTAAEVLIAAARQARITEGDRSAIIACDNALLNATTHDECAMLASTEVEIVGAAGNAAIIACEGDTGTARISGGQRNAMIGVKGRLDIGGDNCVILGSIFTGITAITDTEIVAGGAGTALTWKIHSDTGEAEFAALDVNDAQAISGAGGPPTLAATTAGATGPATAAQATWLRIEIGGVDHFFAAWT